MTASSKYVESPVADFSTEQFADLLDQVRAPLREYMGHKTVINWAKVNRVLVKFIVNNFPEASGNNTEIYIKTLQFMMRLKGQPLDPRIARMIRMVKPEAIPRVRRGVIESTKPQKETSEDYAERARNGEFND